MIVLNKKQIERFWSKYKKHKGCWIWTGAINNGYGFWTVTKSPDKHHFFAHRVAWLLKKGPIPSHRFVLHRCGVKSCINPDHLYLGTQEDKVKNAVFDNRSLGGRGKLTLAQVKNIRSHRDNNTKTVNQLAKENKVGASTIMNVAKRRCFKYV